MLDGNEVTDLLVDWVIDRFKEELIEGVVEELVGDADADYKHERHLERKIF